MSRLSDCIAIVAGATRGTGRGIACALGEQGATVYCTGRSVRGQLASGTQRPETIEETAELVDARGGRGVAVQVDHTDPEQVAALVARVEREAGRVDVLVNDIWGGEDLVEFGKHFWELDLERGKLMLNRAVWTHIVTNRHTVPLMRRAKRGLIVEVTDGDHFGYRGNLFYDLCKMAVIRLAFAMSRELRHDGVTALALTPGFLRSEAMLDHFGVSEANWRDAIAKDPDFAASETPLFAGRVVAALAADPEVARRNGRVWSSWDLAREYDLRDVDGSRPDWGEHFGRKYGPWRSADEAAYASWFGGPLEASGVNLPGT
jgi:NAD(P)-dependent dehydrogenase (short-subunit alcohol dehydrogenase family)